MYEGNCSLKNFVHQHRRNFLIRNSEKQIQRVRKQYCCCGVSVLLLLCFVCGCASKVVRPQNVPADAVFVFGAKIGWWQQCIAADVEQRVHCRIWNGAGLVLLDEDILPYDGGPLPKAVELQIDPESTFSGPDRIILVNKRYLLPKSRFEELKKFVNWLEGKSDRPR